MFKTSFIAFAVLLSASVASAEGAYWDIDQSHSEVSFIAKHAGFQKVRGNFQNFKGTVYLDPKNLKKSWVEVEIDAASIDTNNDNRDKHLRGADFFDVKKFPTIKFKSKKVKTNKKGKLELIGTLELHGVKKPVLLNAEGPTGPYTSGKNKDGTPRQHYAFSASTEVDRFDYGLKWNKAVEAGGSLIVSKEITIELEVALKGKRATKVAKK